MVSRFEWQPPGWKDSVVQVGQEIRELRQARDITLQEIHLETKVPLSHLRSIELGEIERLPAPLFLRGFLQKVCGVLEADHLMAKLPSPQELCAQELCVGTAEPSVATASTGHLLGASQLRVAHLYLGYGVLLAGAFGGLAWSEQLAQADSARLPEQAEANTDKASANAAQRQRRSLGAIASFPTVTPPQLQPPEFGP